MKLIVALAQFKYKRTLHNERTGEERMLERIGEERMLPAKGVKAESTISGAGSSSSAGAACLVGASYPIGVAKSTFRSHSIIDIACVVSRHVMSRRSKVFFIILKIFV